MILPSLYVFLLIIPILIDAAGEWSYNNTRQWIRKNRYCAGHSQSPIDLQFNLSRYDNRLKQLYFDEQDSQEPMELFNSGHTAQVNLKHRFLLKNLAPASEDYRVEQLHFHWGHANDDFVGSEHLHEGQSYPLEVHIVTYSTLYSNIREAMWNTRGLAVVGIFFELSDEPNPLIQPIVDALEYVRRQGDRTNISEDFNLKLLIGEERLHRYYRYDGSLTTPPCFESVIWSATIDPLKISLSQLHAFRSLYDNHGKIMEDTYRRVRPLGTRILFRSFISKDIEEDTQQRKAKINNSGMKFNINIKLIIISFSLLIKQF